MPIIFFKTFNSFFMNGFKNSKQQRYYWIISYMGVLFFSIGFFFITREHMLLKTFQSNDFYAIAINSLFYISFFCIVGVCPILMDTFFNKTMRNSFPFLYVKYMWRKERANIMSMLVELPPEIISTHEISFLSSDNQTLEDKQIQIIRKIWSRNLSYILKYNKGLM